MQGRFSGFRPAELKSSPWVKSTTFGPLSHCAPCRLLRMLTNTRCHHYDLKVIGVHNFRTNSRSALRPCRQSGQVGRVIQFKAGEIQAVWSRCAISAQPADQPCKTGNDMGRSSRTEPDVAGLDATFGPRS